MASIIDQMRQYVERTEVAERSVSETRNSVAQVSQLAYTLNCIWLYAQGGPPSRATLTQAMPPPITDDPATITIGLEYVRKTMIVVRSLISEKVERLAQQQSDLDSLQSILGNALASTPSIPRIAPIEEAEVDELVDDFVPMALNPKARPKDQKRVANKTTKRPWILT